MAVLHQAQIEAEIQVGCFIGPQLTKVPLQIRPVSTAQRSIADVHTEELVPIIGRLSFGVNLVIDKQELVDGTLHPLIRVTRVRSVFASYATKRDDIWIINCGV